MSNAVCTVGGNAINQSDILAFMKITGSYNSAKKAVFLNEVIRDHAEHAGINVDNDTLNMYSDVRRMELGLSKADDMKRYLDNIGISLEVWEDTLENELYRIYLRNSLGSSIVVADAWQLIRGIPEIRNHIADAIVDFAKGKGIEIGEDQLQKSSDSVRRIMGMHSLEEFKSILFSLRMNEDDWEKYLHSNVVIDYIEESEIKALLENEVKSALLQYPVIQNIVNDMVFGQILHAKGKAKKIEIKDEDVQNYIDYFRRAMKMHNVKTFNIWLEASGLTLDQFIYIAETELIRKNFQELGEELFEHGKLIDHIKASKEFTSALHSIKMFTALSNEATSRSIKVTDDEVQGESDMLRRAYGMHSADDFKAFLESHELTDGEWEWFCSRATTLRKLYAQETTIKKVEELLNLDDDLNTMVKDRTFEVFAKITMTMQDIKM
jgi:hypothetical protein